MEVPFSPPTCANQDHVSNSTLGINEPANRFARLTARILDTLLVCGSYLLILKLLSLAGSSPPPGEPYSAPLSTIRIVGLIGMLPAIGITYEFTAIARFGRTIGKALMGLKIINSHTKEPLSTRQTAHRVLRQLILYVVLPLGSRSTWNLLSRKSSSRWYDRHIGAEVVWSMAATSRRRRFWARTRQHFLDAQTRYLLLVLWLLGIIFFLQDTQPWKMTEIQATDTIRTLVDLNGLTFVAFVGTATLAKDIRRVWIDNDVANTLVAIIVVLGVASIGGILSGVAYLSTAAYPHRVDTDGASHRTIAVGLLVTGLYAMAGLWLVKIETDRALEHADSDDSQPTTCGDESEQKPDLDDQDTHPKPAAEDRHCQRCVSAIACIARTKLALLGGLLSFAAFRVMRRICRRI